MLRSFKNTNPVVDATAYVDESAQVIGDVQIGSESSVWMNVVIRGDVNHIRIGKRTNIQDLTMVHVMREPSHPTIIGDEVTIGHAAVIHGCTIEARVLVGMQAMLLNGVHVEHDSIIAAGTYPSLRRNYQTVGMYNFAVARADLPDDLVQAILDAVFDHPDEMMEIHPAAAETVPLNFSRNTILPFHDGAARWYNNKATIGVVRGD